MRTIIRPARRRRRGTANHPTCSRCDNTGEHTDAQGQIRWCTCTTGLRLRELEAGY